MAGVVSLPPLREELHCLPGPRGDDGYPSWTLHDPANNRFFRIGWSEFEIVSRWASGDAEDIAASVNADTTLSVSAEQVHALAKFLMEQNLLRLRGAAGRDWLRGQWEKTRHHWAVWLLHNYLFFRIPLLRPDRFLARLIPMSPGCTVRASPGPWWRSLWRGCTWCRANGSIFSALSCISSTGRAWCITG